MVKRPDGSTPLTLAWAFFIASMLAALIAYSTDVVSYEGIDPNRVALQWTLWLLSGALFQLWLVLWAVGSILRGLWFLPGGAKGAQFGGRWFPWRDRFLRT